MTASCSILLLTLALGQTEAPQAPAASKAEADAVRTLYRYYRHEAEQCRFALGGDPAVPLRLDERPVMNWTASGDWSGSVFVWTRDGRPVLVGCIGSGPVGNADRRQVFHEFHTLSDRPLSPHPIDGARQWTWHPTGDGLEPQEIADAPPPAESPALRLAQMRALARRFHATMDVDGKPWELRMLAQPLYRRPPEANSRQDAALFAYIWTTGTDPEFLLLLETRATDDGPRWHFTPARFTYRPLILKLDTQSVWTVPSYNEQWNATNLKQPYVTVPLRNVTPTEIETAVADPQPE